MLSNNEIDMIDMRQVWSHNKLLAAAHMLLVHLAVQNSGSICLLGLLFGGLDTKMILASNNKHKKNIPNWLHVCEVFYQDCIAGCDLVFIVFNETFVKHQSGNRMKLYKLFFLQEKLPPWSSVVAGAMATFIACLGQALSPDGSVALKTFGWRKDEDVERERYLYARLRISECKVGYYWGWWWWWWWWYMMMMIVRYSIWYSDGWDQESPYLVSQVL